MIEYILTASSFSSSVCYQCFDKFVWNGGVRVYCAEGVCRQTALVSDASVRYLLYAGGVDREVLLDQEVIRHLHLAKTELGFELMALLLLRAIDQLVRRGSNLLARDFRGDLWPQKCWRR